MTLNLSQAIGYNNCAVRLHHDGNLSQAVVVLKQAIDSLRVVMFSKEESHKEGGDNLTNSPLASPTRFQHEESSLFDTSFSSSASQDTPDKDHQGALIAVPSILATPGQDGSFAPSLYEHVFFVNEEEDRLDVICAAIFYNLALVQHKRNLHRGRSLCKIMTLYNKASSVLVNHLSPSEDSVRLLQLAIANNILHIHSTLFDRESLAHSLEQFNRLVYERPIEDEGQYDFFVFSSIYFASDPLQCAPVA